MMGEVLWHHWFFSILCTFYFAMVAMLGAILSNINRGERCPKCRNMMNPQFSKKIYEGTHKIGSVETIGNSQYKVYRTYESFKSLYFCPICYYKFERNHELGKMIDTYKEYLGPVETQRRRTSQTSGTSNETRSKTSCSCASSCNNYLHNYDPSGEGGYCLGSHGCYRNGYQEKCDYYNNAEDCPFYNS